MISSFYWNCRGIANTSTLRTLAFFLSTHPSDLVFLSEPKCAPSNLHHQRFSAMGYSFLASNASSSSSNPNIWVLSRNRSTWTFQASSSSSQHISVHATNPSSPTPNLITAVYASTNIRKRRDLWDIIRGSSSTTLPWCIVGDFNAVSCFGEKWGRRPPLAASVKDFNDMILDAHLMELKYIGSTFTWANNRSGLKYTAARLDRAFCNPAWSTSNRDYLVTHLPRLSSDHSPLHLSSTNHPRAYNIPFKFEEMWVSHHTFMDVVQESWCTQATGNPQYVLALKLKNLKVCLKKWNKEVFGHLNSTIAEASHSVNALQHQADLTPDTQSLACLAKAKADLHNLLSAEETHWKQKSRIKWKAEGDRNTKFFHAMAKSRSYINHMHAVTVNGNLITDPSEIKSQAINFFTKASQPPPTTLDQSLFSCINPSISPHHNTSLIAVPSPNEIQRAVFALKAHSCPGPDGFSGFFFQKCWGIVGPDVIQAVQNFFSSKTLLKSTNTFFLALIPKTANPSTFSDYRPISLLNFSYKIISRILVTRLRPLIPDLISPHQAAFVQGRSIHEHIALAHELAHRMKSNLKGGSLCLKLDISKAFDMLSWDFLFSALHRFGFSEEWIHLIKQCVCTSRGSVLINREPCGFFAPSGGLRQGDPLSPFLFLLAEEILGRNLSQMLVLGHIAPLLHQQSSNVACHLFFADDILIFMRGSYAGISKLMGLLAKYQIASGQVFNSSKSMIFYGKMPKVRKRKIGRITGLKECAFPTTYLGVPLTDGVPSRKLFLPLLDSFRQRLCAWKSALLSFAGRTVLINHVLGSLPTHTFLASLVPKSVILEMEAIMRNFLWSASASKKKANFVRWSSVCKPKSEGGLGIRNLHEHHLACLLKLAWASQVSSSIWADWMHERYLHKLPLWHPSTPTLGSPLWRKLRSLGPFLQLSSKWQVGNGASIMLWYDVWLGEEAIAERFPNLHFGMDVKVAAILDRTGWNIPCDIHSSHSCFVHLLNADLPPILHGEDKLVWSDSSDGKFSVRSAWESIRDRNDKVPWCSIVWSNILPPLTSGFAWRFFHLKTPTDLWAKGMGISLASCCPMCHLAEESGPHLFFLCAHAFSFWSLIMRMLGHGTPTSLAALWDSLSVGCNKEGHKIVGALLLHGLHHLWKSRNLTKFNDLRVSPLQTFSRWQASCQDCINESKRPATGLYLPLLIKLIHFKPP